MKNKSVYQFLHDYFFEHLGIRKKASVKTIKAYKQSINEFRSYLRDYKKKSFLSLELSDFNQDNVYDFLVYLRDIKGQKPSTLNLRLAALKSFMRYCGDEDPEVTALYIALSKIQKFKDPERNGRVEYLTEEQLKLLFEIPDTSTKLGRRDRFIMIMLYETGARIEEFLSIRLSDIYRRENCVQVRLHGKGDKTRYYCSFCLIKVPQIHMSLFLIFYTKNCAKQRNATFFRFSPPKCRFPLYSPQSPKLRYLCGFPRFRTQKNHFLRSGSFSRATRIRTLK